VRFSVRIQFYICNILTIIQNYVFYQLLQVLNCLSHTELLLCLRTVLTSRVPWLIQSCRLYSVLWVIDTLDGEKYKWGCFQRLNFLIRILAGCCSGLVNIVAVNTVGWMYRELWSHFFSPKHRHLLWGPHNSLWVLEYVKWLVHGADSLSAILLRLRLGGAKPPFPYVFNGMVLKKTQVLTTLCLYLLIVS
jgi:hypothetical protein